MFKKILLTLITIFAFANVNAQTFISFSPGCGTTSLEFNLDAAQINGKDAYSSMATPSGDFTAHGISGIPDPTGSSTINIFWDGSQWVFNHITFNEVFTNSNTGALVPDSGWVSDGSPCGAEIVLSLYDNGGAVLSIPKDFSDNNKINVYPNPSSDFISISNLKETVQCRITNIAGQTVLSKVVDTNNNQMDIQELSKGFYFVEIQGKKTLKFIKK